MTPTPFIPPILMTLVPHNEPVLAEVRAALELGSAFQRPAAIELALAEELLAGG